MNTAEILRGAAGRVRQGWIQHSGIKDGRVCAFGGIAATVDPDRYGVLVSAGGMFNDAMGAAIKDATLMLARTIGGRTSDDVYVWNDAKGQTAENVAAGLEFAALLWEQEQAAAVDGGALVAVPVCTAKQTQIDGLAHLAGEGE